MVSAETRKRIEAIAQQLHYTVDRNASNLRSRETRTLALLIFEDPTPDDSLINPFFQSMLGSITRACAARRYDLLVSFQPWSNDVAGDFGCEHKTDGIILLGYGDYHDHRVAHRETRRRGHAFRALGTGSGRASRACRSAATISAAATTPRATCSAAAGATSRSWATPPATTRSFWSATAATSMRCGSRRRAAAGAAGRRTQHRNLRIRGGLPTARGRPAFDAIVAASDLIAIGAMRALQERRSRVPDQVVGGRLRRSAGREPREPGAHDDHAGYAPRRRRLWSTR